MSERQDIAYAPLLDHGSVALVQRMGDEDDIVIAARMSTGKETTSYEADAAFLEFLWSNGHTTPFEMVQLKFRIVCPIFVARQWMRHRTWSYNEYSGRYSPMMDEMYTPCPDRICGPNPANKQGSGDELWDSHEQSIEFLKEQDRQRAAYVRRLDAGMANETARINLGVSNYTRFMGSVNLLNFMKFTTLRMDHHAQWEMQQYAIAMYNMVRGLYPRVCWAFENHTLYGARFSSVELQAIREMINPSTGEISRHMTDKQWARLMAKLADAPGNYDGGIDAFRKPGA